MYGNIALLFWIGIVIILTPKIELDTFLRLDFWKKIWNVLQFWRKTLDEMVMYVDLMFWIENCCIVTLFFQIGLGSFRVQ